MMITKICDMKKRQ